MKSFFDLAQQRRSSRKFTEEPVSSEMIEEILESALMSPSSKNGRPWEFIVVDDKEKLQKLSTVKPIGAAFISDAPLAIVVAADTQKSDVWTEDCSIASIYIQLAAENLGLGSCWIQVNKRTQESGRLSSDFVKEELEIPSSYEVESIIIIGY